MSEDRIPLDRVSIRREVENERLRADRVRKTVAMSSVPTVQHFRRADVIPACHADACSQGRKPCPAPQACHLPDHTPEKDDEPLSAAEGILLCAAGGLGLWALALAALRMF